MNCITPVFDIRQCVRQAHFKIDEAFVVYRMEEAGRTLLALPGSGHATAERVRHLISAEDITGPWRGFSSFHRPPVPDAEQMARMDEALGWIALIPSDKRLERRIVGARCLVSPVTKRHLHCWWSLAKMMSTSGKTVAQWHKDGIQAIVASLNGQAANTGERTVDDVLVDIKARGYCSRRKRFEKHYHPDDELLAAEIHRLRACAEAQLT